MLASGLWLLLLSAALSALIPNIPLMVAGWIPLPAALPLFEALMLGVVIGGSATVIGSSSNLVADGVARQQGSRLGFRTWLWCWHTGR
ncbi:MAG: hypothetical protein ACKN89_13045 [Cyanobium sp.]